MKKLLSVLLVCISLSSFGQASFTFNLALTDSVYNLYVLAKVNVDSADSMVVSLGSAPTIPAIVDSSITWVRYVAALDTYNVYKATYTALANTYKAQERTTELIVLSSLGYGSTAPPNSIITNQWVEVSQNVAGYGGHLVYTNWIGWPANSGYLTIRYTLPTQVFPNY